MCQNVVTLQEKSRPARARFALLKRIIICGTAFVLSGCLYSEKQISNARNSALPIQASAEVVIHKLKSGIWEKDTKVTISREDGFLYRIEQDGKTSKPRQFAFIALGGAYYAIETAGDGLTQKAETIFILAEKKGDSFYLWDAGSKTFVNSIASSWTLQRQIGITCLTNEGAGGSECRVDTVQDLKNILTYVLKTNQKPTLRYQVTKEYYDSSQNPVESIGEAIASARFPTWGYANPKLIKAIYDGNTQAIPVPEVGIYMGFFLGMFIGTDIRECQNLASRDTVYKFTTAGTANFLGGMLEGFKPNPGGRDEHAKQGFKAGISGLSSVASEAAAQADAQLFFDRHGCSTPEAKRFFGNVRRWAGQI